jgi:hypothetical protein
MTFDQIDTQEQRADLARQLRNRAHYLELDGNTADRAIGEQIPEFGLPTRETRITLNQDSALARLFRARAARLDGEEELATRLEQQARQVLAEGVYER